MAQPAALVISDATSYFTRASPRSTFLCGSYDVGAAEENGRANPVTAARRKLTAAAATPYGCGGLMHTGGPRALRRLWESRRRRGELLTIDRTRGSAAAGRRCLSRVSDALYAYVPNSCAKDTRSRSIDVNGTVS